MRVPLIMRGPGHSRRGSIGASSSPTSTSRRRSSTRERRAARAASWTAARCCRSRSDGLLRVGPGRPAGDSDLRAIRTPNWFYTQYASGEQELYDLARDPQQLRACTRTRAMSGRRPTSRAVLPACACAPARFAARARSSSFGRGPGEAGTAGARESSSPSAALRTGASRTRASTSTGACSSATGVPRSPPSSRSGWPAGAARSWRRS